MVTGGTRMVENFSQLKACCGEDILLLRIESESGSVKTKDHMSPGG